ncbi:lectin [Lysobacter sp. A3-1-A15]|uniref:lectin n=1 Tax=Novilysobacter viscosus TaxID=3098602 RepID=UPI003983B314
MPHALPLALVLVLSLVACTGERGTAMPAGTPAVASDPAAPPPIDQPDEDIPPATAPAVPATGPVEARMDGVGPARLGMTDEEVRAAWDGTLVGNPAEGESCFHLSPEGQVDIAHFAMMFGDGRLVRYSVDSDAMVAPGGGHRGMSADDIRGLYPDRVEARSHMYTEGQYLRVTGHAGSDTVIVFETDAQGTVSGWRVGVQPHVDYVEGCS